MGSVNYSRILCHAKFKHYLSFNSTHSFTNLNPTPIQNSTKPRLGSLFVSEPEFPCLTAVAHPCLSCQVDSCLLAYITRHCLSLGTAKHIRGLGINFLYG